MRKKILILSLIFIVIMTGGLYYANTVLLPTVVKDRITSFLSAATGTRVTLESVHIDLLRGIVLNELVISDKIDASQQLLRVQRGSVSLLIIPLLKEKKIIIPAVQIDKVDVRLVRQKDNSWNISSFFQRPAATPGKETPIPLVKNISVRDMTIALRDDASLTPQVFKLLMKNIDMVASFDAVTAQGRGELEYKGKTIPLEISGKYAFADGKTDAQIKAGSLDVKLAEDYFGPLPVALRAGTLTLIEADATLRGNAIDMVILADGAGLAAANNVLSVKDAAAHAVINLKAAKNDLKNFTADGTLDIATASVDYRDKATAQTLLEKSKFKFTYDKNTLTIDSDAALKNASGVIEALTISGLNAEVKVRLNIPLASDPQQPFALKYEGTGKIASGVIDGVPQVKKITGITADFSFSNTGIAVDNATIGVFNTVVTGSGQYADKALDADLQGEFDLADIAAFIPKSMNLAAYKISGAADIRAHVTTPIPPAQTLPNISGEALLKDIWLQLTDKATAFTSSKGRLKFDIIGENLEWHDESIVVNGEKSYSCDGTLKGFKNPQINTMLVGPDFKFNTRFTKNNDTLDIASFKGQWKNSSADLTGTLDLAKQACNVKGRVLADLGDIPLKNSALKGLCQLNIQGQGPLNNFRRWNLKAAGSSEKIQAQGYKAKNINLDYEQVAGIGMIDNLSFEAYGGQGLIKGRFDMGREIITYALRGTIDNLDLAALKSDTPMKDKPFYGIFGIKIAVQGSGRETKNLKGGGSFTIKNGNIWELNPLQEIGTFMFAPRFGKVTFSAAQGDFFIRDNAVSTENLELLGPELDLLIEGKVGFDGTLDFLINSQVPMPGPAKIIEENKIGEAVSRAGSLTAIEVRGTIDKPKYKLLPISANIVKRISDAVLNILP